MQIGMRNISKGTLEWLQETVPTGAGRRKLAAGICARENWTNAAGKPCLTSARLALPKLARRYDLPLPTGHRPAHSRALISSAPAIAFSGALADLGAITLKRADSRKDRRAVRAMLATHHPLGDTRNPGAVLMYEIQSSRFGSIGGMTFHPACWHQKARDVAIGWSGRARADHLGQVIKNSRFLILPEIDVPHLASHVLAQAVRRISEDWHAVHGVRPVLVYTYVGEDHSGACYAGAGWECIGRTSGVPPNRRTQGPVRSVWVQTLAKNWQNVLCQESPMLDWLTAQPQALPHDACWTDREFGERRIVDGRLHNRMQRMARVWENCPGQPVAAIFPDDKPAERAAYRFLANANVSKDDILASHQVATIQRIRDEETVLIVQKTVMVGFSDPCNKTKTCNLSHHSDKASRPQGISTRLTLAISRTGRNLGVLDIATDCQTDGTKTDTQPSGKHANSLKSQDQLDILVLAGKIGQAAPTTRIISVCDQMEGIGPLFAAQPANPAASLVVRLATDVQHSVRVDGRTCDLGEYLASQSEIGRHPVTVAHNKKHTAEVAIRAARVEIAASDDCDKTVPLTAVLVTESTRPPQEVQSISWLLLSSDGETSLSGARTILDWHAACRTIDAYSKTLNHCTRIRDRRLDHQDAQERCLAFDSIIAWHIMHLGWMDRTRSEQLPVGGCPVDLMGLSPDSEKIEFSSIRGPPLVH